MENQKSYFMPGQTMGSYCLADPFLQGILRQHSSLRLLEQQQNRTHHSRNDDELFTSWDRSDRLRVALHLSERHRDTLHPFGHRDGDVPESSPYHFNNENRTLEEHSFPRLYPQSGRRIHHRRLFTNVGNDDVQTHRHHKKTHNFHPNQPSQY